jgi:hypothetical protein
MWSVAVVSPCCLTTHSVLKAVISPVVPLVTSILTDHMHNGCCACRPRFLRAGGQLQLISAQMASTSNTTEAQASSMVLEFSEQATLNGPPAMWPEVQLPARWPGIQLPAI